MDEVTNSDSQTPKRPRIRFGLRAVFVLTTAVCLWLGYRVILHRRANEIVARRDAVLAVLVKEMPSERVPALDSIPPGGKDELLPRLEQTGKKFRRATMFRVDHSDSPTGQNPAIDVPKLLVSKTHPTTIADQLIQHYGSALATIGFHQTLSHGGSRSDLGSDSGSCRGMWSSPTSDVQVIIDGEVFVQSKSATVTILLIDSQQLHLW